MARSRAIRILSRLALAGVVLAGGAVAVVLGAFEHSVVGAAVDAPLTPEEIAALAPRGRYLAAAADCAACHTAPGGAPWAGGLAFQMPFGTLYATNISPDPETGIGGWTRAEFHRAVRDGVGKGGRHLYPAMPYVSYRQLTEADVDALYAFLMTRPPMPVANRTDSFPFPYVRPAMAFWNLLNLPSKTFADDPAASPQVNRGRYLVDALGHCGECHTPRDLTMATIPGRYLEGNVIEGVEAPDITAAGLAALGFTTDGLARFMRAGLGPQGVMSFAMYEVVHHSTQHLTDTDADAMAAYLAGTAPPAAGNGTTVAAAAAAPSQPAAGTAMPGRQTYVELCAACHGVDGEGIPHVAPAMRGNAALRLPTARNLLVATLRGLPDHPFPHGEHMQAMPGFADLLGDAEMAELASYLRQTWGGRNADVGADLVAEIRRGE